MNIRDLKTAISDMQLVMSNPALAHMAEDEIKENFIRYAARFGDCIIREMACEILQLSSLPFNRGYGPTNVADSLKDTI